MDTHTEGWFRRPFKQPTWGTVATVHANCYCNERTALVKRVLVVTPVVTVAGAHALREATRRLRQALKHRSNQIVAWTRQQVAETFVGAKRLMYLRACDSLERELVGRKDCLVQMFIKADKFTGKVEYPSRPRAIQGRTPRFNVELGRFIKPIEDNVYSWKGPHRRVQRSRVFAKGLTPEERGKLFVSKLRQFAQPMVFSLDASSFDSCCSVFHLSLLHTIYAVLLPDHYFAWLCSLQLANFGRTAHKIRYSIRGNRMSGDMDTALGNCFITLFMLMAVTKTLRVRKWDVMIDGDDCVLIMERQPVTPAAIIAAYQPLGFNVTCTVTGDQGDPVPEEVDFCRGRFCDLGKGLVLVRNVPRALATMGVTHKYQFPQANRTYLQVLKSSAMGELSVCSAVPCVGPLAAEITRQLSSVVPRVDELSDLLPYMYRNVQLVHREHASVTMTGRLSIERAFGISVDQQLAYERQLPRIVAEGLSMDYLEVDDGVIEGAYQCYIDPHLSNCIE